MIQYTAGDLVPPQPDFAYWGLDVWKCRRCHRVVRYYDCNHVACAENRLDEHRLRQCAAPTPAAVS